MGGREKDDAERKEATIKMKNDILADIPATVSLALLGSYIPYPSGRANSLPTWNYWWFFKSVKQASRPQSAQGFPFLPGHHLSSSRGIPGELAGRSPTILVPPASDLRGRTPRLLSTLLFIFQTFHFPPPCASFIFALILGWTEPSRRVASALVAGRTLTRSHAFG